MKHKDTTLIGVVIDTKPKKMKILSSWHNKSKRVKQKQNQKRGRNVLKSAKKSTINIADNDH